MEINFTGGAYKGRSLDLNAQVCQNWFPVIDQQDGKSILSLMGTPGLVTWADTGDAREDRGSIVWNGNLYTAIGDKLYKIDTSGTVESVGTFQTSTGRVYFAGGLTAMCIVDGSYGYSYPILAVEEEATPSTGTGGTESHSAAAVTVTGALNFAGTLKVAADVMWKITDEDFPANPTSVCYLDGFFIVSEAGSDTMYKSLSEQALAWAGLDFASAEDQPDDVTLVHAYKRHLMAYGTDTIEVFYNTGDSSFPFTRVAGAVIPVGVGAAASVASGPEGMFFLDSLLQVRTWQGYETQVISTEQIDYQIKSYTTKSDAVGYTYTQEGHSFYVLTFPTAGKTWAYDIVTGFWHTRSSGLAGGRHLSDWQQWFAGKNLVGGHNTGIIYELNLGAYTDNGSTIKSIRAAQVVQSGRKTVFHKRLDLDFEAGVGLSTGLGTGTAVLTADAVTSVTITDGGSAYTEAPRVEFTGGAGSGAVATATLTAGAVSAVTIIAGGSGYTSAPTVTFIGGTQDPQAMLDWSDDGGHTWSNEHWAGIGAIGDYSNRISWRRLGRSRNRIYRVSITDAVKRVLMGAHLEAEVGRG